MSNFHKYKVGDGVTMHWHTDRYPGTVMSVTESGKTVTVQEDDAYLENQDGLGVQGNQCYNYQCNKEGMVYKFRLSKRGNNNFRAHNGTVVLSQGRDAYFDPHF